MPPWRNPSVSVGVLALIGLVLGSAFGFSASRVSSCVVDGFGLPPDRTCYRYLGHYVSGTTHYTVSMGLAELTVGLVIGSFIVLPMMLWRDGGGESTLHVLVLIGLPVVELAIVVPALLFLLPDPGAWPEVLRWAVAVVALVALTYANYVLRRRFLPRRRPLTTSL